MVAHNRYYYNWKTKSDAGRRERDLRDCSNWLQLLLGLPKSRSYLLLLKKIDYDSCLVRQRRCYRRFSFFVCSNAFFRNTRFFVKKRTKKCDTFTNNSSPVCSPFSHFAVVSTVQRASNSETELFSLLLVEKRIHLSNNPFSFSVSETHSRTNFIEIFRSVFIKDQ